MTGSTPSELCVMLDRVPTAVKIRYLTRVAQCETGEWRDAATNLLAKYSGGAIADAMEPQPESIAVTAAPKARRKTKAAAANPDVVGEAGQNLPPAGGFKGPQSTEPRVRVETREFPYEFFG